MRKIVTVIATSMARKTQAPGWPKLSVKPIPKRFPTTEPNDKGCDRARPEDPLHIHLDSPSFSLAIRADNSRLTMSVRTPSASALTTSSPSAFRNSASA